MDVIKLTILKTFSKPSMQSLCFNIQIPHNEFTEVQMQRAIDNKKDLTLLADSFTHCLVLKHVHV